MWLGAGYEWKEELIPTAETRMDPFIQRLKDILALRSLQDKITQALALEDGFVAPSPSISFEHFLLLDPFNINAYSDEQWKVFERNS